MNESKKNYFIFFKKPDKLIHLAWEGLPNYNEFYHFERNLLSNYNFIKNIIKNGLKDLNVIGTCFEYGMQSRSLSENLQTKPINAYGLNKDTLRNYLEELKKKRIPFKMDKTSLYVWIRIKP